MQNRLYPARLIHGKTSKSSRSQPFFPALTASGTGVALHQSGPGEFWL